MIADDQLGRQACGDRVPVPGGDRRPDPVVAGDHAFGVAAVELRVGCVEVVGVEPDCCDPLAALVQLDDVERLEFARPDVATAHLEQDPSQREPLAASRENFCAAERRLHLEHRAMQLEEPGPIQLEHVPPVEEPRLRRVARLDRGPVPRVPRLRHSLHRAGRGVREPRLRGRGGELVEARERLCLAFGLEYLDARDETFRREDSEQDEMLFVTSAACAYGAHVRPPQEHCVGAEGEDVVEASDDVLADVESRFATTPRRLRAHAAGRPHAPGRRRSRCRAPLPAHVDPGRTGRTSPQPYALSRQRARAPGPREAAPRSARTDARAPRRGGRARSPRSAPLGLRRRPRPGRARRLRTHRPRAPSRGSRCRSRTTAGARATRRESRASRTGARRPGPRRRGATTPAWPADP